MAALSPELLVRIARRCGLRTLACLVCASKELRAAVAEAVEEVAFATEEGKAAPAWRLDSFPRLKRLTLDLWEGGRQLYDTLGLPALRSGLTSLRIILRRKRTAEPKAAGWGGSRGDRACLLFPLAWLPPPACWAAVRPSRPPRLTVARRACGPASPPGQPGQDEFKEEHDPLTVALATRLPGLSALELLDYTGPALPQLMYAIAGVPSLRRCWIKSPIEWASGEALAALARMKPCLWPNLEVGGAAEPPRSARPAGGQRQHEAGQGARSPGCAVG
jgi:hypothetical protein